MLIQIRLKDYIHYDVDSRCESVMNISMERLINFYKIYCENKDLISKLRKIKDHRNDIAHKGFIMEYEEMHNSNNLELKISELKEINEFAKTTLFELIQHIKEIEKKISQVSKD